MSEATGKRNLKVCQYAEGCYRKNPIHFGEFAHPHLDKIFANGRDETSNEYVIPDELASLTEIINIQLKLLETVFPNDIKKSGNESKTAKIAAAATTKEGQTCGYRLGNVEQKSTVVADDKNYSSGNHCTNPKPSTSSQIIDLTDGPNTSNLAKKPKIERDIKDYIPVVLEKGLMAKKLENAAPYNMFLTAVTDCKQTHNEPLSVTLQEILDESLGEIQSSAQINFMVDIGWLLGHYYFAGIMNTPLLVLYGADMPELSTISQSKSKVTAVKVNMSSPFATSHTKMMLFSYKDNSMRVVISTANLYEDDWCNRTQGVWISPKLPSLPEDADITKGESPTGFRQDLLQYLTEYKLPQLTPWLAMIRKSDFSAINVFLIASVPGGHREIGTRGYAWGHARLSRLLQKHATIIDEKVPVVCQSSSIGSLGPNVQSWIQHDMLNSLRKDTHPMQIMRQFPPFKMIYPSFGNVINSLDGIIGGACLPYGKKTNDKQPWLTQYLHQWCSNSRNRSRAVPHIKSYTRYNLDEQCVYWFALTSANLSKAAWGAFNKGNALQPCLRIFNYEAGVLFLPKFVTGEETFPLGVTRNGVPPFPLPYDVPLTRYGPDDKPFLIDYMNQ